MKLLLRLVLAAAALAAGYTWLPWREWMGTDASPQLSQEFMRSLIIVEGDQKRGSGFVCEIAGKKFALTNQHVVAGNPAAKFTLLDQSPIPTGQAAAAVGHDIMSFAVLSDVKAMVMMTEVDKNAAVGDDVVVPGNSDGDGVIKPLAGKLIGIGPYRVEVSAEFVHGNSGSPIIHVKSGKVIGIATYARIRKLDGLTGKPKDQPEVKRFGFRIDSVRQWQPVTWAVYNTEFQLLEKIQTRTGELLRALKAQNLAALSAINYTDPAIRGPLGKLSRALSGEGLIKTNPADAFKDLVSALRSSCDGDVAQARTQLRYDRFRRELDDEQKLRELFYKAFDALMKTMMHRQ